LAQTQRLPSAEDPLASYTTKASLIFTPHNPSGFSDKMLRQLCTDRKLPPPNGVVTWDRVTPQVRDEVARMARKAQLV
jgi:hypothetical protein